MFRFMVRNEFTPRMKNGQPDHRMTGVAKTSSSHSDVRSPSSSMKNVNPTNGPIASTRSGTVRTVPTQNRRVKSTSSGFGPSSSRLIVSGSSPMPQIGHDPGPGWRTCACIGQV